MDSNLSTSSSDLYRWIRRVAIFLALTIGVNLLLLILVFIKPDKLQPPVMPNGANRILILGASNVVYGIDTLLIPGSIVISLNEPYGVYGSLLSLRNMAGAGDVIICDYPYSWMDPQKFVPSTAQFYHTVTAEHYWQLCRDYPVFALKNFLLTNILNEELLAYLIKDGESFMPDTRHSAPKRTDGKDPREHYNKCSAPYVKAKHFIYEAGYDEAHFLRIRTFIEAVEREKGVKIFFKYPELNRGNYEINPKIIEAMRRNFKMINSFEDWPNDLMFDQWYHLNACGRERNSKNITQWLRKNGFLKEQD